MKVNALDELVFDNRFLRELPADPETDSHRRQVFGACHSAVAPSPVPHPKLIAYSSEVAEQLGLSPETCESPEFAEVFSGNRLLPGMAPHAACYGGHQFGQWAGQLGDGRAINLGETVTPQGEHLTLQLKGAGPTPYSRSADGLAVLRSSIREFLCSEAMHHLGVPTTRALSLIATGQMVIRDMFYDGRPKAEPGAVVCRVAPSFTRFGNFEIFAARDDIDTLRKLADFTIRADFPDLGPPSPAVYAAWFEEVCRRTAVMIVHWQRVGFVHGVMNTDNMSILGLTIDYGPYGWLEDYDPDWTPNTTDASGRRYRYGNQPAIAYWNLVRLAQALYPLLGRIEPLEAGLGAYTETFDRGWRDMMARKLGLRAYDDALVTDLLALLRVVETDMTLFYRRLASIESGHPIRDDERLMAPLMEAFYVPAQITRDYQARAGHWLRRYLERIHQEGLPDGSRIATMNAANPKYVLRNYLAQLAIDQAEQGDYSLIGELLDVLRHPYDEQTEREAFAAKRPDWARHRAGCSMLSCSS